MSHDTFTRDPAQTAEELLQAGLAASQAEDSQQALRLFAQATEAAPQWAVPHFLIGSEQAALGEMEKAESALANAVLLDPAFHVARYQLGLLQYSSGRAAAALVTWQPLAGLEGLEGQQGMPAFVRGFAALANDDFEAARSHFADGLQAPDVNPAMAADIQKVLDGISALGQAAAPQPTANTQPSAAAAHLMVAAYDRNKLH